MSTFDGVVKEFPFIRIDYFRKNPDQPPPLVCFLSHVHSDHLQGLESLRSPFIYCSAVTRELLLRIEKYPHRINFAKGILETRKQHYGHLAKLLRPIPLNTPTEIVLTPKQRIRVTLFDANHCPGAVMFLIEGDGKSILYTGDIRSEKWWVDALSRHPILIPYTRGLKTLDTIYLDTTFATNSRLHRAFPPKAEGIRELLEKVQGYPKDTIFYLRAWTFGYEEVWQALSVMMDSKVHVDRYQFGLYRSLIPRNAAMTGLDEATYLSGYRLGNVFTPGCLTADECARIHSCEPGVLCQTVKSAKVVVIDPIVTRDEHGTEIPELGVGGGKGDLYQHHELELPDEGTVMALDRMCREQIKDERLQFRVRHALRSAYYNKRSFRLEDCGLTEDSEISTSDLIDMISKVISDGGGSRLLTGAGSENHLPRRITFPYSRHASYKELCALVVAFRPKDIHPCTVDPVTWSESSSMESLFGHLCSGTIFAHDQVMRQARRGEARTGRKRALSNADAGADPQSRFRTQIRDSLMQMRAQLQFQIARLPSSGEDEDQFKASDDDPVTTTQESDMTNPNSTFAEEEVPEEDNPMVDDDQSQSSVAASPTSTWTSDLDSQESCHEDADSDRLATRRRAYRAARKGTFEAWCEGGGIVSAGWNHSAEEIDL